jgi:hypothetical protein
MKALTEGQIADLNRNPVNISGLGTRLAKVEQGGYLTEQVWEDADGNGPVATDADGVLAATTLADGATTTVTEGFGAIDFARALTITGSTAGITGNVVITGTNIAGQEITETIASSGTATVAGAKAFASVTKAVLPARNAEGNTISIGFGDILGLNTFLARNTVLAAFLDNAREATAPAVVVDTDELEKNTIDLSSALNGKVVRALFVDDSDR